MRLVARFLVIAAAVWLVAAYVPGVTVSEGVRSYFWIALVFAAVNLLVKPVADKWHEPESAPTTPSPETKEASAVR